MGIVLLNLQSNQQIHVNDGDPLIIGRGNIPGCSDKRVSRSHGKVSCTADGKLHVIALHTNPCFFTRNGIPPVQQLTKNQEQILSEGDCLGLLPDSFWFQITSKNKRVVKKENNFENKNSREVLTETTTENENSTEHRNNQNLCLSEPSTSNSVNINEVNSESCNNKNGSSVFGSPDFEKTKRLPLWMYEIDEPTEIKSSVKRSASNSDNPAKKMKIDENTFSRQSDECKIKRESSPVSASQPNNVIDETFSRESEESKIKREPSPVSPSQPNSVIDETLSTSDHCPDLNSDEEKVSLPDIKTEQENGKAEDNNLRCSSENVSGEGISKKSGYESVVKDPSTSTQRRPICQYEENCFRKNPQHKLEYSHPCDPDFIPYENRPLCQYGEACYRRNPIHRTEYRHVSSSSNSRDTNPTYSNSPSTPSEVVRSFSSNLESSTSSSSSSIGSRPPSNSSVSSTLPAKRRRKPIVRQSFKFSDEETDRDPFETDDSLDEFVVSFEDSEDEDSD